MTNLSQKKQEYDPPLLVNDYSSNSPIYYPSTSTSSSSTTTSTSTSLLNCIHLIKQLPHSKDLSRIIISCIIFLVFFLYGNCLALLGPSLPSLSNDYHHSIPKVGSSFTFRGIGFGIGTLLSAYLLTWEGNVFSKEFYILISIMLMNLSLIILLCNESKNFIVFLISFLLQGISFGGIDTIGNCLLPELWGKRSQPWMQALHFSLGFGSIISPVLIGNLGYKLTFFLLSIFCFSPPTLTLIFSYFYLPSFYSIIFNGICEIEEKGKNNLSSNLINNEDSIENNLKKELIPSSTTTSTSSSSTSTSISSLLSSPTSKYSIIRNTDENFEMKNMNFNENISDEDDGEEVSISFNNNNSSSSSSIPPYVSSSSSSSSSTSSSFVPSIVLTEKELLTPSIIKILVFVFYFLYVGAETSFGGWISGYLILTNITSNEKTASYVSSLFWSTLTLGRFIAIICSLYLGSRRMIQLELILCFLCSFFMLFFMYNLSGSLVFSSLLGFCFSAMFPVMLSLISEYGFKL